jgi:hypothetical protein
MNNRIFDIKGELSHLREWLSTVELSIAENTKLKNKIEKDIKKLEKELDISNTFKVGDVFNIEDLDEVNYDSSICVRYFNEHGINIDLEISQKAEYSELYERYEITKVDIEDDIFNIYLKKL